LSGEYSSSYTSKILSPVQFLGSSKNADVSSNYTDISSAANDDNSLFRSIEELEEKRKQEDHLKIEFSTEEDTNSKLVDGFSWKCLSCRGSVEVLK
jgi:hypothetical protein